jgi:hypothetical protein
MQPSDYTLSTDEHFKLIFEIYSHIPRLREISAEELRVRLSELGVNRTKRTIQRYLNVIMYYPDYFLVERFERARNSYSYKRKYHNKVSSAAWETMLLGLCFSSAKRLLPLHFEQGIHEAFMPLQLGDVIEPTKIEVRLALPKQNDYDFDVFERLSQAINAKRQVRLILTDDTQTDYLTPLGLIWEKGMLYLVYEHKNEREALAFSDITQADISTFTFEYPSDFSLSDTAIPTQR